VTEQEEGRRGEKPEVRQWERCTTVRALVASAAAAAVVAEVAAGDKVHRGTEDSSTEEGPGLEPGCDQHVDTGSYFPCFLEIHLRTEQASYEKGGDAQRCWRC